MKILRVMHKIKDASPWFSFVYQGFLHLKNEIMNSNGIALYPINNFHFGELNGPNNLT